MTQEELDNKIELLRKYKEYYQLQSEVRHLRDQVHNSFKRTVYVVLPKISFSGVYDAIYDPKTGTVRVEKRVNSRAITKEYMK